LHPGTDAADPRRSASRALRRPGSGLALVPAILGATLIAILVPILATSSAVGGPGQGVEPARSMLPGPSATPDLAIDDIAYLCSMLQRRTDLFHGLGDRLAELLVHSADAGPRDPVVECGRLEGTYLAPSGPSPASLEREVLTRLPSAWGTRAFAGPGSFVGLLHSSFYDAGRPDAGSGSGLEGLEGGAALEAWEIAGGSSLLPIRGGDGGDGMPAGEGLPALSRALDDEGRLLTELRAALSSRDPAWSRHATEQLAEGLRRELRILEEMRSHPLLEPGAASPLSHGAPYERLLDAADRPAGAEALVALLRSELLLGLRPALDADAGFLETVLDAVAPPDLAVQVPVVEPRAGADASGGAAVVRTAVENKGLGPSSPADLVWLHRSPGDASVTVAGSSRLPPLAPGGSITVELAVDGASIRAGTYSFGALVAIPSDRDRGNDEAWSRPVRLEGACRGDFSPPDASEGTGGRSGRGPGAVDPRLLRIGLSPGSRDPTVEARAWIEVEIENRGAGGDLRLLVEADGEVVYDSLRFAPAGRRLRVWVPWTTNRSGEMRLRAEVEPRVSAGEDGAGQRRAAAATVNVASHPLPNIVLEPGTLTCSRAPASPGEPLLVSIVATNAGTAPLGSFDTALWIDGTQLPGPSFTTGVDASLAPVTAFATNVLRTGPPSDPGLSSPAGASTVPNVRRTGYGVVPHSSRLPFSLPPGGSVLLVFAVAPPHPGPHSIQLFADPRGRTAEANAGDNWQRGWVLAAPPLPDLAVGDADFPLPAGSAAGEPAEGWYVRVRNRGAAASAPSQAAFYMDGAESPFLRLPLETLPPGGSSLLELPRSGPLQATGVHHVTVRVDPDPSGPGGRGDLFEVDESNNVATGDLVTGREPYAGAGDGTPDE